MQTFVPFEDHKQTAKCLDKKRLFKQLVESRQILDVLNGKLTKSGKPYKGWINHPAVLMWKGFELELGFYSNTILAEVYSRDIDTKYILTHFKKGYPDWWGGQIHLTHQSNLLRKNKEHYSKYFNLKQEQLNMDYFWPGEKTCKTM